MKKPSAIKLCFIFVAFLLFILGLYCLLRFWEKRSEQPEAKGDLQTRYQETLFSFDGASYRERKKQTRILLIGIDKNSMDPDISCRDGGQADMLRLLVIDDETGTVRLLDIDRDTFTPITVFSVLGDRKSLKAERISLSHAYGFDRQENCRNTVQAVSTLLLGCRIDGYLAFYLDGIPVLNDYVGGVTVTLEDDDLTSIDPTLTAGTVWHLEGDQAEFFVRNRMTTVSGTNASRMARQKQFFNALEEILRQKMAGDKSFLNGLYQALEPFIVTDMASGRLINLAWRAKDYQKKPEQIQGEHRIGNDGYMLFLPAEGAVEHVSLSMFFEKVS